MEGHKYGVQSLDISLTAGVPKTVCAWITGATRRCWLYAFKGGGASATAGDHPMLLEVVRYTADGTGTAATPVAIAAFLPASIGTAKINYTIEPTGATSLWGERLSPVGNTYSMEIPPERYPDQGLSGVLGLRVTALTENQSNTRWNIFVLE